METWLEFARGPLFRFAIVFMILGLARHVALTVLGIVRIVRRTDDKAIPWRQAIAETLGWLVPFGRLRQRAAYSITSVVFHVGLILVPIFLAGHILLIRRSLGFGWPALPPLLADGLTLLTVAAGLGLIAGRLFSRESRALTGPADIGILALLVVLFLSGFAAAHPWLNPVGYNATMLVHVLAGNLLLILIPLTKLVHCALLPASQIVAEAAWRFPPEAGEQVVRALNRENEPI
jgi:nitrate reductase gamma subunit